MPCALTSGRTSLTPRLMVMAVVLKSCQKSRSSTAEAIGRLTSKERYSFGAQFAEVTVDVTTGEVRVRRMLGMSAAGRIVNPLTARSQFVDGMIWGLSMALHEEAVRDGLRVDTSARTSRATTSPRTRTSSSSRRTGETTPARTTQSASRASARSGS